MKSKRRLSFSKALDNHPSLKGKQSNLPDQIQQKIVQKSMQKKATKVNKSRLMRGNSRKLIHPGPLVISRDLGMHIKKASHDPHYGVIGGQEGRMAKRQLHEIQQMAEELYCCLEDGQDLHEWVQIKLATIHDRLQTVHSYMMYEKEYPKIKPMVLGTHM